MRRREAVRLLLAGALLPARVLRAEMRAERSLAQALAGTQASGIVLDGRSGAVLATCGVARRGTPGSAIKPLLLDYALAHNIVRAETEVYCRRDLRIGARSLPCTHPPDQPVFDARSALAESCNTWFAAMGRRFTNEQLEDALKLTRLPHRSMSGATAEQRELAVLGLEGVSASPVELASAYREMLGRANGVVAGGLRDSVAFGMAHPAFVRGLNIAGKTGTASDPGEAWTHGWFAGALDGRVVVIFVPHGDGGTAATLAQAFFRSMAEGRA